MNCASASVLGSEPLLSMNCATKFLIHRFSAGFHWSIQYEYTYRRAQMQWIVCSEMYWRFPKSTVLWSKCTLGCQRFCNPNIREHKKVESIRNAGQRLRNEIRGFWKTICRLLGWITSLQWLTHFRNFQSQLCQLSKNPCYPEQPTDSAIWLLRICLSLGCMHWFVLFCPNWWYGYPEARKDRDSAASQVCHWQSDRKGGDFFVFLPCDLSWGEGIFDGCPGTRQEPRSKTFVSVQDAAVAFKFSAGMGQKVSARAFFCRRSDRCSRPDWRPGPGQGKEILQLSDVVPILQGPTFQVSGKVLIQGWTNCSRIVWIF